MIVQNSNIGNIGNVKRKENSAQNISGAAVVNLVNSFNNNLTKNNR